MISNSLLAVSIVNRITELHDPGMTGGSRIDRPGPDTVIYVHPTYDMRFIGRWCTIRGKRSGGYVIRGALDERYDHESGLLRFTEKRLRPGFSRAQFQRAVHAIASALAEERTLKRHREQVYILSESRELDLDKIDAIAEGEGRQIAFSNMTIADCEFWKIELEGFPQKAEPR
jgi:hypothetical protein